jgi:hypothetical protein
MVSSSDLLNVKILVVDDLDLKPDQIIRAMEGRACATHKSFNAVVSSLS